MFTMDVPYVPAQQTPIVLAQAATPGAGNSPQPDYILKGCTETEHGTTAFGSVAPTLGLANYLERHGHATIDLSTIKITLLEAPAHGELVSGTSDYARSASAYFYDPAPEYIGKDRAVFMAEFEGKRYKIVVDIHVLTVVNENSPTCPPSATLIKINKKPASGSTSYHLNFNSVSYQPNPAFKRDAAKARRPLTLRWAATPTSRHCCRGVRYLRLSLDTSGHS